MQNLTLRTDFTHSYTREFGSHHVNNDGSERYCICYSFLLNGAVLPLIALEFNSSDNMYYIYSNRDCFDNFLTSQKIKTKKEAIAIATKSYSEFTQSQIKQ